MIYGSHRDVNMWKLVDFIHQHKIFPVFGNGENLMQPIHARDLGTAIFDVFANIQTTKNRDYNIAGMKEIPYKSLLRMISEKLNRNTRFIHLPISISLAGAYIGNALTSKFPISVEQVQRMNEDKVIDYSYAYRDFGYSPMAIEEGIQEEVDEYLNFKKTGR